MSWLSNLWKKESTKVILNAAISILKVLAFGVGERLWNVTKNEVAKVENLPISGPEKAKKVWKVLEEEFNGLPGYIGNLSIELAYAYLKEASIKK